LLQTVVAVKQAAGDGFDMSARRFHANKIGTGKNWKGICCIIVAIVTGMFSERRF
jgi:hypothetical protein